MRNRRNFLKAMSLGGAGALISTSCSHIGESGRGGPGLDGNVENYEPGLVMELPLLDSSEDISGRGADGMVRNVRFLSDPTFGRSAYFNGYNSYIEVPSRPEFSFAHNGGLTVSFWVKPETLNFSHTEGTGPYVNYIGKGQRQEKEEWLFRIYNKTSYRPNRMSVYLFNPEGGLGIGSYVQEGLKLGNWMFVTGVMDGRYTHMYKNGKLRDSDDWHHAEIQGRDVAINPMADNAPVRIGTYNGSSWFQGRIVDVRIYNRALSSEKVFNLFRSYYE